MNSNESIDRGRCATPHKSDSNAKKSVCLFSFTELDSQAHKKKVV